MARNSQCILKLWSLFSLPLFILPFMVYTEEENIPVELYPLNYTGMPFHTTLKPTRPPESPALKPCDSHPSETNNDTSSEQSDTTNHVASFFEHPCGLSTFQPDFTNLSSLEDSREAKLSDVPFIATIQLYFFLDFQCSAAIIGSHWLLAHRTCFLEFLFPVTVYLPEINNLEGIFKKQLKITKIFSRNTTKNDDGNLEAHSLVLVKLKDPIKFNNQVQPICLPKSDEDQSLYGKMGIIAGRKFIKVKDTVEEPSNLQLKVTSAPILRHDKCRYESGSSTKNLTENFLCSGAKTTDRYDTGPFGNLLMVQEKGVWTLVGMGASQADLTELSPYYKISNYFEWIHRVIYENNYEDTEVLCPQARGLFGPFMSIDSE